MEYSERSDFEEKSQVLSTMSARLAKYKITSDFSMAKALEIGGAGGVLGGLLSKQVGRVIVTDVVDTQLHYNGEFPKLLKEKFIRNGYDLSLEKIEFQVADAMQLPYKDDYFDLVVSLNAFEHIPDLVVALREAVRVTKKGGSIYLSFDPVWTADSGSHFAHMVKEPWAHLINDTEEFCDQMVCAGAGEELTREFRLAMNRKPISIYRDTFPEELRALEVSALYMEKWSGCVRDEFKDHPNRFAAAKSLGCSADDLLIRGFCFIVRK